MENEKKIRKQIYLEPEQNKQVKQLSILKDKPEAVIIREAIDGYLISNSVNQEDPLYELIGMVKNGSKNGSTKHDNDIYLAEKGNTNEKR